MSGGFKQGAQNGASGWGASAGSRKPGANALALVTAVGAVVCVMADAYLAHDTFHRVLENSVAAACIAIPVAFSLLIGPMWAARFMRRGNRGAAAGLMGAVVILIGLIATVRVVFGVSGGAAASGLGALAGSEAAAAENQTANLLASVCMAALMLFTSALAFASEYFNQSGEERAAVDGRAAELRRLRAERMARSDAKNAELFSNEADLNALESEYAAKTHMVDAVYDSARLLVTSMLVARMPEQADADELTTATLNIPGGLPDGE